MIGYFGKIPSHGDFVARGLPPHLVAAWDQWLQACVHASQQRLGERWLAHYLTSPVWRFAIAPGVLGPEGLGGVMMPSVDRVGRYFPLMIAATGAPALLDWFRKQGDWYDAIEDLARAALAPEFKLDQFDAPAEPDVGPAGAFPSAGGMRRFPFDAAAADRIAAAALEGHALWWTEGSPNVDASLLMSPGMPAPEAFAPMLDGSWGSVP